MLRLVFAALLALAARAAARDDTSPYFGRDGAAEARAIVDQGGGTVLYSAVFNGRIPGWRTPGLRSCSPREEVAHGPSTGSFFLPLPEADYSEGDLIDEQYVEGAEEAWAFAAAFNLEMFRLREGDIRGACPRVEIEPAG